MKRILFCTYGYFPYAAGGAERQAQLQAEELTRRGYRVTIVTPKWPGTVTGIINGVPVKRLRFVGVRRLKRASYLIRLALFLLVRARGYDLLCVHLAELQAHVVVLVARLVKKPVWVKLASGGKNGEIARMRRAAPFTRDIGLRGAARVQAISEEIAREALAIGVGTDQLIRIPNGVDTEKFAPAPPEEMMQLRRVLGLLTDRSIVLFVGRLSRQKGIDVLLHAWSQAALTSSALVIVGSFNTVSPIQAIAESDNVILRPWTDDISAYYRSADVFVLPSFTEGMSNALLEAMSCGVAVISTRVGAAEQLIVDRTNGLLVEPGDEAGLANALRELVSDRKLRTRLGAAAAATIQRHYAIGSVVDHLEQGYRGIGATM